LYIREESTDGYVINIEDKKCKAKNPIHNDLIKLGLIAYLMQ
jgi:hypothetical protein